MKELPHRFRKEKLDQHVLDIEFLLISVIQGVAVAALAGAAVEPFNTLEWPYMLYVISGFFFILNFWAQAVFHTLSFIDWPIDMTHNFLYFWVGLIEVIMFADVTDPLRWFIFSSIYFGSSTLLYFVDIKLIKRHQSAYEDSPQTRQLYKDILSREQFELKSLLPLGFLYNVICALVIYLYPHIFLQQHYHIVLVFVQLLTAVVFLADTLRVFRGRVKIINKIAE